MIKYRDIIIKRNVPSSLNNIVFHSFTERVERFSPEEFPVHVAVHEIREDRPNTLKYVDLHKHPYPEINILIGNKSTLSYNLTTRHNSFNVESPASIYIPAGIEHSANLIEGAGFFVCIILCETGEIFGFGETESQ